MRILDRLPSLGEGLLTPPYECRRVRGQETLAPHGVLRHRLRTNPHNRWRFLPGVESLEPRRLLTTGLGFRDPISLSMGIGPEAIAVADLDGDGFQDLATANFADDTVTLRFGRANAQLSGIQLAFAGQGPADILAVDLDGKQGLDLVTANLLSGDTSVLLSLGGRQFAPEVPYETGTFSEGLAITDLNEDGVTDLLVAASGTRQIMGHVSVLIGDQNNPGTFAPATTLLEKSRVCSVVADYFDQDENLDLVVVSFGFADDDVSVALGQNDGTYGPLTTIQTGGSPYPLVTADLNGDGDLDLVTTREMSGDVSVFLGHGDGTFATAATYGVGGRPRSEAVADLDEDGVLDLATADSSGTVSVLRGVGDGTFTSAKSFAASGNQTEIAAADIDGDGHLDLVVGTQQPSTVQILLNTADDVTQLRGGGDLYQQDFDTRLPADGQENATGTFLPAE